jgi:hypothetical protein
MTDAKDSPDLVSNNDVAKKETSKQSKKLKSTTVKDVISKIVNGYKPDMNNIRMFVKVIEENSFVNDISLH